MTSLINTFENEKDMSSSKQEVSNTSYPKTTNAKVTFEPTNEKEITQSSSLIGNQKNDDSTLDLQVKTHCCGTIQELKSDAYIAELAENVIHACNKDAKKKILYSDQNHKIIIVKQFLDPLNLDLELVKRSTQFQDQDSCLNLQTLQFASNRLSTNLSEPIEKCLCDGKHLSVDGFGLYLSKKDAHNPPHFDDETKGDIRLYIVLSEKAEGHKMVYYPKYPNDPQYKFPVEPELGDLLIFDIKLRHEGVPEKSGDLFGLWFYGRTKE